jgi:DNA-binding transcriptional LysR family regulator
MDDTDRIWDRLIGERIRLRELRILHTVVRSGSMAKAAAALSLTQPAVSQAIGLLESALGVPLLERTPAGAAPTEFGEAILRRALDALDALSEGVREVAMLADPGAGTVVVGASESFIAGGALGRTVRALGRRYPRMRIDVVESNTAAMDFADLQRRRVDVMLGRVALSALPDYVHADVLLHEALLVVTGGQNAWAHRPGIRFADLGERKWVLAPPGSAVHELVAAGFRAEGAVMPAVAATTWSMMLRLQLLASDEYVTAFPESLVRHNAARWNLQVLPVALGHKLPVAAFTLKSRAPNRAIQAFIAAAREASAGQAPGS